MIKTILLLILLFTLSTPFFAQTTFSNSDIQGAWVRTGQYKIEFKNKEAKYTKFYRDIYPAKLLNHVIYTDIKHHGNNLWTDDFRQCKYTNGYTWDGR